MGILASELLIFQFYDSIFGLFLGWWIYQTTLISNIMRTGNYLLFCGTNAFSVLCFWCAIVLSTTLCRLCDGISSALSPVTAGNRTGRPIEPFTLAVHRAATKIILRFALISIQRLALDFKVPLPTQKFECWTVLLLEVNFFDARGNTIRARESTRS